MRTLMSCVRGARLARVQQTLIYLTDERVSASRANSKGLLPLIRDIVEVGGKAAFRADLGAGPGHGDSFPGRAPGGVARVGDRHRGTGPPARTSTRGSRCGPPKTFAIPSRCPAKSGTTNPVDALVATALGYRPELAENQALVQAALTQVRRAQFRPWLPNLNLTYGWGDFGGGPDLNPQVIVPPTTKGGKATIVQEPGYGPSGEIHHFSTRTDLDVNLYWKFDNMGFGNLAEIKQQKALHQQATLQQMQVQNTVVTQVVQAHQRLAGWRDRLQIARSSFFDARRTLRMARSIGP